MFIGEVDRPHRPCGRGLEMAKGGIIVFLDDETEPLTRTALKYFKMPRCAMFLTWWWLAGEDGAFGVARAMEGLIRRWNGVGAEIQAAWAGKAEGWRKWRDGQ